MSAPATNHAWDVPLVSFVIPAYNCAQYLPQAIDSALAQTHPSVEIIVVNDGSPDDTNEVVKPFLGHVTYIKQANRGLSAARNVGFRASRGDFICFLDADDIVLPDKIERQLRVFLQNPDLGIVISDYIEVEEDGRTKIARSRKHWNRDGLERLLRHEVFAPHAALIRRSVLQASSLFPEDIDTAESQEDWQLWLEMALGGVQFGSDPEPTCLYRYRQGSIRRSPLRHNDGARRVVCWLRANPAAAKHQSIVTSLAAQIELERAGIAWRLGLADEFATSMAASLREDACFWNSPRTLRRLFVQALSDQEAIGWEETIAPETMRRRLVDEMLPALRPAIAPAVFKRLVASAYLTVADFEYGKSQPWRSRRALVRALGASPAAALGTSGLPSVARAILGPRLGAWLARSARFLGREVLA